MSVIPIPYWGNPSSINMVEYEHKWWICDTEWRQVRTEMICDAGWWHFSTWRFREKKSLVGIGIRTHDLVSSCLVITFLTGICISAINHFVPIGSQYSGGPWRGRDNLCCRHRQHFQSLHSWCAAASLKTLRYQDHLYVFQRWANPSLFFIIFCIFVQIMWPAGFKLRLSEYKTRTLTTRTLSQ